MPGSWMHRLAWMLGAFTLVLLGAIVGQIVRGGFASELVAVATRTPISDPQLEAMLQEREQAYQALITEANARLEQAYRQIQELSAQLSVSSSNAPAGALERSATLSPARAIWVAMNAAPGSALMKEPELVFFQGALAYEVVLDQGTLYIDANTGQILYEGVPSAIQAAQAPLAAEPGRNRKDDRREDQEEHRDDD